MSLPEKPSEITEVESIEKSLYPICQHVKITGERCGSPAVRDEDYCYYHRAVRKRVPRNNLHLILWNPQAEKSERYEYEMPYPEDPESLQIAFSQFIHVVSQEEMKVERATLVLSALHGAAANMRAMEKSAMERERISRAPKKPAASVGSGAVAQSEEQAGASRAAGTADPSAPLRSGRDDKHKTRIHDLATPTF